VINIETTSACIAIYHSATLDVSYTGQSKWLFVTNGDFLGQLMGNV
jgi:hypothetical protein